MTRKRQTGQLGRAKRLRSLFAWGLLAPVVTIMTGCSQNSAATAQHDPLTGVMVPPGTPPPPPNGSTTGTPPQPHANNVLPAIPTTLDATTPASIAGTSWNRPSLAIDDKASAQVPVQGRLTNDQKPAQTSAAPGPLAPNPKPRIEPIPDERPAGQSVTPAGSWQTPPGAPPAPVQTANAAPTVPSIPPAAPNPNSPPTLPAAQPRSPSVNVPGPIPVIPSAAAVPTAESLTQQLKARGVTNQKQDVVPEGVHLTCYVNQGSGGLHIYEVTAPDYISAAQKILQDIQSGK